MMFRHFLVGSDRALFAVLNGRWTCRFLDAVMPAVTDFQRTKIGFFLVILPAAAAWLWWRRARGIKVLIALALAVGLTDLISARALKPMIHRARPEYAGLPVVLREGTHSRYGFPSNHAVNMFAAAGFLYAAEPALAAPAAILGAVIAYSRVYVGAHFPLDVLGGALFGWLAGWLAGRAFRKFDRESTAG